MLKPPRLKPGDTLGVIAPSSPVVGARPEAVRRARAYLAAKGFRLRFASQVRRTHGHAAGTIRERAEALHAMFRDPRIAGILTFWGGYQSHQLLEYLDYGLIRRHPKALLGYSDITALQAGIFARTGLVGFSGPGLVTFLPPVVPSHTWEHFERVVMHPVVPLTLRPSRTWSENVWWKRKDGRMIFRRSPPWTPYRHGRAAGRLLGGNLGTFLLLHGTPYWPDLRGAILFAEEDETETTGTVDRLFTKLRQIGALREIRGLVIGRFPSAVGFSRRDSLKMILDDALRGTRFPVLTGVEFGHTQPLVTLPIGVRVRLDARRRAITLLEAGVR
ncbi:MAG: S66 peptidase family protein [bacterium]